MPFSTDVIMHRVMKFRNKNRNPRGDITTSVFYQRLAQ